jgi:outer membrane protein W
VTRRTAESRDRTRFRVDAKRDVDGVIGVLWPVWSTTVKPLSGLIFSQWINASSAMPSRSSRCRDRDCHSGDRRGHDRKTLHQPHQVHLRGKSSPVCRFFIAARAGSGGANSRIIATRRKNKGAVPMSPCNRLLIHLALAMLTVTPLCASAEKGDWLLRLGYHMSEPKDKNLDNVLGGDVEFDKAYAPALDVTYMLTDHIGTDLFVPAYFSHDLDLKTSGGTTGIGDVDMFPPVLGLQWHFNIHGSVQPYIGAGVNWTKFSGESLSAAAGLPANSRLEFDDTAGIAGRIGVDIGGGHWFANLDARWIDMQSDATIHVPAGTGTTEMRLGEARLDPWIYGIGIGYRFRSAKPLPEPAPEPVAAAPEPPPPPEKCADTDADGVCDADDKCPGTAAGTKVDRAGCPLSQTLRLLFDFDSAELRPESISELERLVKLMNDVPFATATIEGHTDSVGTDAYNLALSDRRAKAVFDYMTARGVDPARLKSVGKGEADPIADNKTEAGRQENRRVLLIRTDMGT